ncbi:regulator of nonsense transcripts 3A [Grus japonensis]|uniref:Regulator of nonsense transcripts 3A n=1 Tax=Grus japonensis TaxID=30415 RepID=A0ABC9W0W1_GRUJA
MECAQSKSRWTGSACQDRPAMQLYQPGARIRTHTGSTSKTYDCSGKSFEDALDKKYEADNSAGGGSEKSEEAE